MICSSTIELTLMRMCAGLPSSAFLRSFSMSRSRPLRRCSGGDEEALELLLDRVSAELVEQAGEVLADLGDPR